MSPERPSPGALAAGDALSGASYALGAGEIRRFNRYVTGGVDTKNIHTDDEAARRAGLPRAVVTGRHPVCYLAEWMVDLFGTGFASGGALDVAFVKPIFPGDTVRLTAKVREKTPEDGRTRVILEVALLNQDGVPVTVGTASGLAEG